MNLLLASRIRLPCCQTQWSWFGLHFFRQFPTNHSPCLNSLTSYVPGSPPPPLAAPLSLCCCLFLYPPSKYWTSMDSALLSTPPFFFKFNSIFKLYIIVLVLPNIKMNPPQVYMCSPSWTLLHPPSPYHPSGSSQCTSPMHPVSCIEPGLATRFIHDILHVSMPFSQIFPPTPSPTESIRRFYTSVSLLLSCTQGYCYHLSKFHIYMR